MATKLRIPQPLRSYVLSDRHDEAGESHAHRVVFAESARDARGFGLDDTEYLNVVARRAPEFDVHSPGPVPLAAMLAAGWRWECGGCCEMVAQADLDDGAAFVRGAVVFCSPECEAHADGCARGFAFARAERAAVSAEARRRWPTAYQCYIGYNGRAYREPFAVDGFRVSVRLHWHDPDADVYATWWDGAADHDGREVYPREGGE